MYTGFYTPSGMVPKDMPNILNNGARAQDATMVISNQDTANMFMWRLMNLAISVFKWENLPEGIDERMIEWWLLRDGFVGFFFDEILKNDRLARAPEGFAVLPLQMLGDFDNYEYPVDRMAYSVSGNTYALNEMNSVIIFNNYLRVQMWQTLWHYAYRLAETQRTIDINIHQQRTGRIVRCDEKQKLSYLNAAAEVDEGKPWIHADKNFNPEAFQAIDTTTPYIANDLQIYKHQLWNEALTYLGIENTNTDKKERMISDEVLNNMGDVESERFTRLNARKQAVTQINEKWGLDIKVDFRAGAYVNNPVNEVSKDE